MASRRVTTSPKPRDDLFLFSSEGRVAAKRARQVLHGDRDCRRCSRDLFLANFICGADVQSKHWPVENRAIGSILAQIFAAARFENCEASNQR